MELNPSWVGAIASLASALVVAITAVAAFVQIRHVRNTNEITVFLRLVDRLDSFEAEESFAAMGALSERLQTDPAFRDLLATAHRVPDIAAIASLLQFLEHLSTLVVTGGVTERLVLMEYADNIDRTWDRLAETISLRRNVLGPYYAATFEHVAMRAKRFLASGEMRRRYGRLQRDPRLGERRPFGATTD